MLDVKELIGVFLPKFRSLGVKPLLAYYGGSLANGTYEDEKSDIDVVIVADSAPSDVWMGGARRKVQSFFQFLGRISSVRNFAKLFHLSFIWLFEFRLCESRRCLCVG